MKSILLVPEVAEECRVPVATVRYWRATGKGPKFVRMGKRLVCRRADLDRWLDEQFADA